MRINKMQKSLFSVTTVGLGELLVFPLTCGQMGDLEDIFGGDVSKADSVDFVRALISLSTCPKSVTNDNAKPKDFSYKKGDLSKLTKEDLEEFSRLYAEREANILADKNLIEGKDKRASGQDKVVPVKSEAEDYIHFTHRLVSNRCKQFRESLLGASKGVGVDLAKIMATSKGVADLYGFSNNLRSMMGGTLAAGESLRKMIGDTHSAYHTFDKYLSPKAPLIDHAAIARQSREALLQPFKPLYEKLERLNSITGETGNLISLMNETQSVIAGELKSSSDSAMTYSKINFKMNIVIIVLTFLSLVPAVISTYFAVHGSSDGSAKYLERVASVESSMAKLVEADLALHDKIASLTEELSRRNAVDNQDNKEATANEQKTKQKSK